MHFYNWHAYKAKRIIVCVSLLDTALESSTVYGHMASNSREKDSQLHQSSVHSWYLFYQSQKDEKQSYPWRNLNTQFEDW